MTTRPLLNASVLPDGLQSLLPGQARFCLGVERFILNELGLDLHGCRILAAFSGGADSTALLLALHYLAPRLGCTLHAAHLDHRLRPGSAGEAEACRRFCEALGISLLAEKICWTEPGHSGERAGEQARHKASRDGALRADPQTKAPQSGVEDASRSARYAFFKRAAKACGADWIATGHNANDLAEDVLMRLTRGTGWPGLAGMAAVDPGRQLLRPLLLTPRKDIEHFVTALGTGWLTDESNSDRSYFRNRVRLDLLPFFVGENPAFLDTVAGLWRLGRIDAEFFDGALARAIPESGSPSDARFFLPRPALAAMPKALRLRLYKQLLDVLGRGQALMPGLLALDEAFTRNAKRTEHQFPGGKRAVTDASGIAWFAGSGPDRAGSDGLEV